MIAPSRSLVRLLSLVAGSLDFVTGLGLVFLPALTLRLMLVMPPEGEALHAMRFVGCFVASVGASYLWGLIGPASRLRAVFGVTRIFRLAAGSFTLWSVLAGHLSPAWLSVSVTDFGLLLLQTWFLRNEDCWK